MCASFLQPAGQPNSEQITISHLQLRMSKAYPVLQWKFLLHLTFLYQEIFFGQLLAPWIFFKIVIRAFTTGLTKEWLARSQFQLLLGKCLWQEWLLDSFGHHHHFCSLSRWPYLKMSRRIGSSDGNKSLPGPIRLLKCVNVPNRILFLDAIALYI